MAKVLFFFTSSYPFGKGETFIENEIEYLSKAFEKVIIISNNIINEQTRVVPENVELFRKSFRLSKYQKVLSYLSIVNKDVFADFYKHAFFKFSRINYLTQSFYKGGLIKKYIENVVKQKQIDTSNLYLYSYWWLDEAVGIARYKTQKKDVVAFTRAHGYDLYFYRSLTNYLPLKFFTANYLNKVFTISEDGVQYLSKKNITNIAISRLGTQKHIESLKPINYSDCLTIASCGQIYPNKNIKKIAEALQNIKNIKINWIHFGSYIKDFSEQYYADLLSEIEKLECNTNIKVMLMGNISNKDLIKYYKNNVINLFINTSESEGIPVSIMEAMSFGIPCMATSVGGTPEIVNNQNGFLLSDKPSSKEISNCIEKFYYLPSSQKENKRNEAFKYWNTNYNATTNYNNFIKQIFALNK